MQKLRKVFYWIKCKIGKHNWTLLPTKNWLLDHTYHWKYEIRCARCGARRNDITLRLLVEIINNLESGV